MGASRRTLSVVLPNYNHARYLPEAIEGILNQTRRPDEFLILDDCSTDNSVEIIQDYVTRHDWIKFVQNAQNQGVNRANERLFRMASSDFVYAGAADDIRTPKFFEAAMEMAEKFPQAGLVFGDIRSIDEAGNELAVLSPQRWQTSLYATPERFRAEYLEVEAPSHSHCAATIYRRDAFEEVGYYRTDLGPWADSFAVHAIGLRDGVCYVPQVFTEWRVLETSFSGALRSDPRRTLDLIARAARLMRSPEFRDRFPEDYVANWELRYRNRILQEFWWGTSTGDLKPPFSRWQRYRVQIPRTWKALQLARYRPDPDAE